MVSVTAEDFPDDTLDYEYIRKCSNGKELEKILKRLRSNEVGKWQQLETFCEERLREVHPKSKLLRITTNIIRPSALDSDTKTSMDQDIADWLSSMSEKDSSLKGSKDLTTQTTLPNVRSTGQIHSEEISSQKAGGEHSDWNKKANPDRIRSYDYRAWDKFDPEEACEAVEKEEESGAGSTQRTAPVKPSATPAPRASLNPTAYADKERASEMEKEKGNEAFRAGDFQESINYYTNSIDLHPTAAALNNRGLAKIRLERYVKAIDDFNLVLTREPDNVKALLRRADAREKIGQIREAAADLERSVIVDEKNKRAKQLLDEFKKRHEKLLTKGGKRMKIVESSDEEDVTMEKVSPAAAAEVAAAKPVKQECTRKDPPPLIQPVSPAEPVSQPVTPSQPVSPSQPTSQPSAETSSPSPAKPDTKIIFVSPLPAELSAVKEEATELFKMGSYGDAIALYTRCIEGTENREELSYHRALLLSNRAACKLKIGDCVSSVKDCNDSLAIHPRFFKSILRRAVAFENLENFRRAYDDYRLTLQIDPSQLVAQQGMHRVGELLRRRHGSDWRSHVTQTFSLPSCPEFVFPGTETSKQVSAPPHPVKSEPLKPEPLKPEPTKHEPTKPEPVKQPTTPAAVETETPPPKPDPSKTFSPPETSPPETPSPSKPDMSGEGVVLSKPDMSGEGVVLSKPLKMATKEEQYLKFKEQGNKHVGAQDYKKALNCYAKCTTLNPKLAPAHLNSALCHLKLGDNKKAIACAGKVLELEPKNIKALYRRASAHKALSEYPAALKDLKRALELDGENKAARQLMDEVKKLWAVELRGMQTGNIAKPTTTSKPAGPKKGQKIQIVQESSSETSDSDSSDEEVLVKKPAAKKQPEPAKKQSGAAKKQPEPVKNQAGLVKKQPEPAKKQAEPVKKMQEAGGKKEKPWLKSKEGAAAGNTEKQPDSPTTAPTSFSFLQHWNEYKKKKDETAFAKLLESCDSATLARLFSTPMMESDMVMGICGAINLHFIPNSLDAKAVEILTALTKAPRFDVITMLLSQKDKKSIHSVISKLNHDEKVLQSLMNKF